MKVKQNGQHVWRVQIRLVWINCLPLDFFQEASFIQLDKADTDTRESAWLLGKPGVLQGGLRAAP